ncbi:MAG: hypothetical protein JXA66_01080 [Oligoflexia bacterium]|nr:hypothetical protein [Oligoflexia bacterium]
MPHLKGFLIIPVAFLLISGAEAKKFANSYIEFDMPDTWNCKPEGGQHICQPVNPEQRKEAIVVMASKYKGPGDEMKEYYLRLQKTRAVKDLRGKSHTSKLQYAKFNTILGTPWVDAQQEGSEVPGFITRYLATVNKGLGIAITFSAHKSKFKQYSPDFYRMVKSIRVRENIPASRTALAEEAGKLNRLGPGAVLGNMGRGKSTGAAGSEKTEKRFADFDLGAIAESDDSTLYLILAGAGLLILYIIIRRRRRRY